MSKVRAIALYLPQFHPIPENDEWWGRGFTEWTNVVAARPLFKSHYQPHLPADLGFYDLRIPDVREAQACMAREHSIHGFCYYHYWFNGRLLLNKPVDEVLHSGRPDFPFCLCWANENWTRIWDGAQDKILIKQDYNFDDDIKHIQYLFQFFMDKRYIRINDKPLFIIYKPKSFPDIKKTVEIWRTEAGKAGMGELYLAYFENGILDFDPYDLGFDAAIEFQPNWKKLQKPSKTILQRIFNKLNIEKRYPAVIDYADFINTMMNLKSESEYKKFRCVTPMWDNSARRGMDGVIFKNSTPALYEKWFSKVLNDFKPCSAEENLVFINAWNEWAEGNHLEPCKKWGFQYLLATKSAIEKQN